VFSEIIRSEQRSCSGARIRRNQATSLVAAGRGSADTGLAQRLVVVLGNPDLRRKNDHSTLGIGLTLVA